MRQIRNVLRLIGAWILVIIFGAFVALTIKTFPALVLFFMLGLLIALFTFLIWEVLDLSGWIE